MVNAQMALPLPPGPWVSASSGITRVWIFFVIPMWKKASKQACSAAAERKDKKVEKYKNLSDNYHFVPVGMKTYGAYGPQGLKVLKKIGKKIGEVTGEKRSTYFLLQSISMAVQRANAACVLGTVPASTGLEGLFEFFLH